MAPCVQAYNAAKKRAKPQINAYMAEELGRGCPFTRPWTEVWEAAKYPRGYDSNKYGQVYVQRSMNGIKSDRLPAHMRGRPDMGAQYADYGPDPGSARFGIKTARDFKPVITIDPSNRHVMDLYEKQFLGKIAPRFQDIWLGFCARHSAGGGFGNQTRFAGTESVMATVFNFDKMLNDGFEPRRFTAVINRDSTLGVDAVQGVNSVWIFGLRSFSALKNFSFTGNDFNFSIIANISAVTELEKLGEIGTIGKKIANAGNNMSLESWEKTEFVNWGIRGISGATGAVDGGTQIVFIDTPIAVGLGLSYTKWTGTIIEAY